MLLNVENIGNVFKKHSITVTAEDFITIDIDIDLSSTPSCKMCLSFYVRQVTLARPAAVLMGHCCALCPVGLQYVNKAPLRRYLQHHHATKTMAQHAMAMPG